MFSQLWSSRAQSLRIEAQIIAFEKKVVRSLGFLGEQYVNAAKNKTKAQGGYKDDTGNLRASIGWMILKDGREVSLTVERKHKDTARLISELKTKFNNGFVLVVFAGMEYAIYLEAGITRKVRTGSKRKGKRKRSRVYDVITGSLPTQGQFTDAFHDLMN